jgi:predicted TIM-barrel fold metal-dependent hydrolase
MMFGGCSCCGDAPATAAAPAGERAKPARLSRRAMLGAAAGAGAALATGSRSRAASSPGMVDVHHHLAPPGYVSELIRHKLGERPTLDWTPEKSLADMDASGVASAMLSITTPGVWFGEDAAAVELARVCNDFGAKLKSDYPRRFGLFAALPLPDVDLSLREVDYALGTLKADGIGLLTSYGRQWLGDPAFAPVLDELNRRKAVVFVHPTAADCCRNLIPGVPASIVEFGTDTSRTIASLLFTGTASRCPDIKFIFSHAGGTMPFLIERYQRLSLIDKNAASRTPEGVVPLLQRFFYDTAQAANPAAMAGLTKLVSSERILFGTDFPFRRAADQLAGLARIFDEVDLHRIEGANARALMPQLAPL